ncbi:hypothetical protein HMPREF3113_01045 [Stenotrophomonas sp. HMSC10F06]|uniref:hypothetical protein n=1 Tax=Stenotrophomonas sp. HMSC10F06 TaxID=1581081 RepID=UPI0008AE8A45|nr:hypothetical protein [Stenotrophomonas sp. HMSC10F06]OFS97475.1 hypothetical protein HMPREF3113_01045 [Stenotrophomonas sp. HMSC10F06]
MGSGAGLSRGVIALLVAAIIVVAIGFARLTEGLFEIGLIATGMFIAIGARICQAREQHQALYQLLQQIDERQP